MTYFQAVFLGVLQGITEFFPVSSSGHLVIVQKLFGIEENILAFDIYLHLGTLFAVFAVFRTSILTLVRSFVRSIRAVITHRISIQHVYRDSQEARIIAAIMFGTIPAVIVGFTMKDFIESLFHNPKLVLFSLLFTGLLLIATFFIRQRNNRIGVANGIFIGLAQALAILPGVSRSGMTISAALFLGVKRENAGEFSFLLSIPVILGATLLEFKDSYEAGYSMLSWDIALLGVAASFLSGWLSLVFLMRIVRHGKIGYFGIYCIAIALVGFFLF
ncbi:undecaprenyl-diphosphate phosphatase [Candidatus Latescibacterota bacterium]